VDNSDRITPELVLVDPSLRARLQAQALLEIEREELDVRSNYPVVRAPRPETPVAVRVAVPEPQAIAPSSQLGPRRSDLPEPDRHEPGRHSGLIASAPVLALLLVVPLLAFLPPRQAPRLVGPSAEAGVVAPRALRWAADPRANYYLLRIFLHDRLVHRTIVRAPTAVVPPLPDGIYDWDVYAGYGRTGQLIRRGPIADATFTVASPEATAAVPLPDEDDEPRRSP
jgi:hypothetical protein